MVFLFPDARFLKCRQGHTLYDRLPHPRGFWRKAEELTGEKIIGFSFGTPTEAMKPGPVATLGAFLHSVSAAEALIRSRKTPLEVSGLGIGFFAAAVCAAVMKFDDAVQWLYTGKPVDNPKFESPRYALRSPLDPNRLLTEGDMGAFLAAYDWKVDPGRDVEGQVLVGFWSSSKVQTVIVPGPGAPLAAQLRKWSPGIQSLPAAELEDIGTILKVAR